MLDQGAVTFLVNGKVHEVQPGKFEKTLVQYLRESGLTGTKQSCGEGSCGACTVLLTRRRGDGYERVAVNACTSLLWSLQGTEVTTVEGLGSTKTSLHPVQERLYLCHGSQCGFCSPGMVMSMTGVLCRKNPPDIEDILMGLQGNLCRCTGYRPILEAFSTFASSPMEKDARLVDQETEEVATYDLSKFKALNPADLEVTQESKALLESIKPMEKLEFPLEGRRWFEPVCVEGALRLHQQYPGAVYRLGGTGGYKLEDVADPKTVISLTSIPELKGIFFLPDGVLVKAGVTYSEFCNTLPALLEDKFSSLRVLKQAVENIGSVQLRNVATVIGGILWGHPASDVLPILTVTRAQLEVQSLEGVQKKVEVGPRIGSLIRQGDLVTGVFIPHNLDGDLVSFNKQARRMTAELAVVNLAVCLNKNTNSCQIVIGGIDLAVNCATLVQPIQDADLEKFILSNFENISDNLEDLKIEVTKALGASGNEYKNALLIEMLKKLRKPDGQKSWKPKAHQLFEKTSKAQDTKDPITRPIPIISSAEQCTGEATYVDDIPQVFGELLLVPVHSAASHAKILNIDASKALEYPNVVAWISAADVPGTNLWASHGIPDEEVFTSNNVSYYGQIIGVLAAKDLLSGKKAAELVKVSYELLPAITNIEEAIQSNSNLAHEVRRERCQDADLLAKEVGSFEGSISMGGQEHFYMETHSALAIPGREKDEMTIYCTTQQQNGAQINIASVLGIPQNRIILKTKRLGGGFGGKERPSVALIAAVAAKKLNQPCRLVLDRESDFATSGHKHQVSATYKVGYTMDGLITSTKFFCNINGGATNDATPEWSVCLAHRIDGGYTLQNTDITAVPRKTNLLSTIAFRGFGGQEGCLIIEDCIERIALETGLDPALVRVKNITRKGDQLHYGDQIIADDNLFNCWNECLRQSNYFDKKKEVEMFNNDPENVNVKRGISIIPIKFPTIFPVSFMNQASAFVRIYTDGSVMLSHGGVEMGQGLHTKMVQVAARVLNVDMGKIHIIETSTETNPNASPTGGSTGTELNGHAVMEACQYLADKLAPIREANPNWPWEQVVVTAYMQRIQLSAFGFYNKHDLNYDMQTNKGVAFNHLTNGVACCMVEVDCSTGNHEVLRTDIVMDVGQSLNPAIDIGQIEGAFVQGYGFCTMEEMIHDKDGQILTNNFSTYKVPTVSDIPQEFNVTLLRNSGGHKGAVYSSKGIGEPGINLSVSVLTALRNAVSSYRVYRDLPAWFPIKVPFTAERIFKACHGLADVDDSTKPWRHV